MLPVYVAPPNIGRLAIVGGAIVFLCAVLGTLVIIFSR